VGTKQFGSSIGRPKLNMQKDAKKKNVWNAFKAMKPEEPGAKKRLIPFLNSP